MSCLLGLISDWVNFMHEIEVGKTRIEFNEITDSRESLASPLGDEKVNSIVLARISNQISLAI